MSYLQSEKPVTIVTLANMRAEQRKMTMLTCYDASFAALLDRCGIDLLLVGDSLGNVIQGHNSTLPVNLADMAYHTRCVSRATRRAMVVSDMPFGSYQQSPQQAFDSAATLMAAGAQMVKLEGGEIMADTIHFLTQRGIPVCAHIGLTPQSVHQLGGYRVQGRGEENAQRLRKEARLLQDAGAALLVMEMVPAPVAAEITQILTDTATIGIGAGADCDGQVLVLYDMLGIYPGKTARFVKNFMQDANSIEEAIQHYIEAVRQGSFPAAEHSFSD